MRLRRRQAKPTKAWRPGLAWLMATSAMAHFSLYAPEFAPAKEPTPEDDLARKRLGLPDRNDRDPNSTGREDRWGIWDPPSRGFRPTKPTPVAQSADDTPKEFDFDIPPQPLASALHRFGEQAGVQFAYATEDVANVRTGGVSGRRTSEEALRLLLVDTGLAYRITGTSIITLEKGGSSTAPAVGMGAGAALGRDQSAGTLPAEPAPKPIKVPEVVVKDVRERPTWTTPVDGYKADHASTVTRSTMSIDETPVSIGVITRDLIRDTFSRSQGDAFEGVSGISHEPMPDRDVQKESSLGGFRLTRAQEEI